MFIGYSDSHKGYKCLDQTGCVYVSSSVTSNETNFPFVFGFASAKIKSDTISVMPSDAHLMVIRPVNSIVLPSMNSQVIASTQVSPISNSFDSSYLQDTIEQQLDNNVLFHVDSHAINTTQILHVSDSLDYSASQATVSRNKSVIPTSREKVSVTAIDPSTVSVSQNDTDSIKSKNKGNTSSSVHPMQTRSKGGIFKPKVFIASQQLET